MYSPSNAVYSPESELILPKSQINDSVLSEFCSELNTYTINADQLNMAPAQQTLSQFEERHVMLGFDDSASVGSVDLETSLYESLSNEQSDKDELESIQSDYTDLLSLSADAMMYETVTNAQEQTQKTRVRRGCRDEQRAQALSLPLSVHDIIHLPVEAFNEAISTCKLNHAQHTLIRDIRRRGKNKMAAQSCRKRKMDSLFGLEDEIEDLKRKKDQCMEEKERNARELCETKEKVGKLYNEVFRLLKDEHGNSYNPREYKLQLSTDGTVYLLPRNTAHKNKMSTGDLNVAV
ncbi:nuclear factor erythroid 2-related factor 2b isoform X4 [Danio rerio]